MHDYKLVLVRWGEAVSLEIVVLVDMQAQLLMFPASYARVSYIPLCSCISVFFILLYNRSTSLTMVLPKSIEIFKHINTYHTGIGMIMHARRLGLKIVSVLFFFPITLSFYESAFSCLWDDIWNLNLNEMTFLHLHKCAILYDFSQPFFFFFTGKTKILLAQLVMRVLTPILELVSEPVFGLIFIFIFFCREKIVYMYISNLSKKNKSKFF